MKQRTQGIVFIILFSLLLFGLCGRGSKKTSTFTPEADTIIITHFDTITVYKPSERTRTLVKLDTIFISTSPTYKVDTDTISFLDSISSALVLPLEQAVYADTIDAVAYKAYISGYKPQLDSIFLSVERTQTIINQQHDPKFSLGVQLGYGASKQGFSPYIGVGIQYNIRLRKNHYVP